MDAYSSGLVLVDNQLEVVRVDIVAEQRMASSPFPFAAGGSNLIAGTLRNDLTLELSEGQQHVQDQPAHGSGRVKQLCYGDKGDVVLLEGLHHAGKVKQRTGQAIYLVDYYTIYLTGLNVQQQAFQGRPLHIAAGEAAIIIMFRQAYPPLGRLAFDIGFAGLTLGIQRIEFLFQALFGALPRVNGTADRALLGVGLRFLVHGASSLLRRKKRKPLQCWPVMALATADSER